MSQKVFQDFGFSLNSITFLKCESEVLAINRLSYKDKNKQTCQGEEDRFRPVGFVPSLSQLPPFP